MCSEIFRNRLVLLYLGWGVLFLVLIAAPVAASDDLLIRNVILVSPERDELVHNIDVLVHDGYIREIAENIEQASAGTRDVSENIALVNQGAAETGQSANEVLGAAVELSKQSESLGNEMAGFLTELNRVG